jgi:signal transduction histidine kinase
MTTTRGLRRRPRGSRIRAALLAAFLTALVLVPAGLLTHAGAGHWQDSETRRAGEQQLTALLEAIQEGESLPAYNGLPFEIVAGGAVLARSKDVGAFDRSGPIMPPPGEGAAQPEISGWTFTFPALPAGVYSTEGSRLAGLRLTVIARAITVAVVSHPLGFPELAGLSDDTLVRAYVFLTPFATELLRQRVDVGLAIAFPMLVGLAALCAGVAVGRSLRSVERLREQTVAATATGSTTIVESDTDDELSAMASAINDNVQRLRDALAAQQQFVADAAHELRNPLSILISGLEIAERYPTQVQWPDALAQALRSARRLQDLTQDLLVLAQLDARAPERTDLVALRVLCTELIEARRVHGATSIVLFDGPDFAVLGDRGRLERVVGNLLDNAIRHAVTNVSLRLTASAGQAILDIHNDGPAIIAADRERIFDRFTRLDEARARNDGGAGLGLAIAREAANRHGGTVSALPLDAGATFRVTLPLHSVVVRLDQMERRAKTLTAAA